MNYDTPTDTQQELPMVYIILYYQTAGSSQKPKREKIGGEGNLIIIIKKREKGEKGKEVGVGEKY